MSISIATEIIRWNITFWKRGDTGCISFIIMIVTPKVRPHAITFTPMWNDPCNLTRAATASRGVAWRRIKKWLLVQGHTTGNTIVVTLMTRRIDGAERLDRCRGGRWQWHGFAVLEFVRKCEEYRLYVVAGTAVLRGCLKQRHTMMVGVALGVTRRNHYLIVGVTLVTCRKEIF